MKRIIILLFFSFLIFSFKKEDRVYVPIKQDTKLKESIKRGKEVYVDICMFCHYTNGEGKPRTYPPLAKSDYLMNNREASIRAVKYGMKGKIIVNGIQYNKKMSKPGLNNEEVADVMNYITNSWGNKNDKMITIKEVESVSKK